MKILVTGSEGSLMQFVIPLLLQKGYEVIGVDNFARYGVIERKRDYKFIRGDLTNPEFVDEVMAGVDGVIQAAALIYGVGGFNKYPADILSKDVVLHQNILWSMLKHKVKKIAYISSSMVYERCQKHPSKEEDAMESLIPMTDYGLSKLVGERLCMSFQKQYGIDYVIWRPFNINSTGSCRKRTRYESCVRRLYKKLSYREKKPTPYNWNRRTNKMFYLD